METEQQVAPSSAGEERTAPGSRSFDAEAGASEERDSANPGSDEPRDHANGRPEGAVRRDGPGTPAGRRKETDVRPG